MRTPKPAKAPEMTEDVLMKSIIDFARQQGWLVAHFRPALTKRGWRTPVSGDGAGWPDVVLARERVLYREIKTHIGKLSAAQELWVDALRNAGQDAGVWRPADWPEVICRELLRRGKP